MYCTAPLFPCTVIHLCLHVLYCTLFYWYCTSPLFTCLALHSCLHVLYCTLVYMYCTVALFTCTVPHLYHMFCTVPLFACILNCTCNYIHCTAPLSTCTVLHLCLHVVFCTFAYMHICLKQIVYLYVLYSKFYNCAKTTKSERYSSFWSFAKELYCKEIKFFFVNI